MYQILMIEMKKEKKKMSSFDVEGTILSNYATLATDDIKYLFKNDRPKYKRIFDQQLFALPKSKMHFETCYIVKLCYSVNAKQITFN